MRQNIEQVPAIPAQLPFLQAVCWQTADVQHFTQDEMLDRYERGWGYKGVLADLEGDELDFVQRLARAKGSWLQTDVWTRTSSKNHLNFKRT